ncbi:MAG: hypothetical protein JSU87_03625 [Gemmatimonadota bacterium]|nr:MAG: hypothetical protein JSU87_03625 [Gemmatimonadota bacterium]
MSSRPDQQTANAPLWRRLQRLGPRLGREWQSVRSAGPQLDAPAEPTALGEAQIMEDSGRFAVHDVGPPSESRFEFFLDGIEHTRIAGYVGVVPVVHGYVAAVIRRRRVRQFVTWSVREHEVLSFPHKLLPVDRFIDCGFSETALIDSSDDSNEIHPIRLAESSREAVKLHRARLESGLARRWAEELPGEGWLLVDGRLAIDPVLLRSGRAFGLVKSHRTQYLSLPDMTAVLGMSGGQRSSIFKPVRPEIGEVYSWYLRLRPASGHDIYWALARMEGRAAQETLELADEVSRWLIAETAPLALPDPRWHILLYPIRDCELYLRARMPTLDIS